MSGFDDSPFGDSSLDNPFADPAIQQVTRTSHHAENSLEDYNPFEHEQSKSAYAKLHSGYNQGMGVGVGTGAAIVQPQLENIVPGVVGGVPLATQARSNTKMGSTLPPVTGNSASQAGNHNTTINITTAELQRRQEELDRKAEELDRREQQLHAHHLPKLNNWPPLPDNPWIKPCFYQDFNLEIPPEFQQLVKYLYYVWMFYTFTMCANIIGGLIILFHAGKFTNFGLALFYFVIFTPASYMCWFRPAYKAFRDDSSFNFMVFFFVYFFQTLITLFQVVGFNDSGYCGFVVAISAFNNSASGIIVGLLLLCIALCYLVCLSGNIVMITKIHSIYRSTGASMAKAQAEFATEFMRNQNVQGAAASAANAAINQQFSNRRY